MNDKKQKVVIAGASGFIGRRLIESLLSSTQYDILGLSRFPTKQKGERVISKQCDEFIRPSSGPTYGE
ncbi:MAG: NAD-dependent epimerase/dehydratase family protein [Bacteriovoracaceae bacterium]